MKKNKKPPAIKHPKSSSEPSRRVAVIVSPGSAQWGSCHTIGTNLRLAYELAEKKLGPHARFEFLNYGDNDINEKRLATLAKKILAGNYSCLSFLEHWPPPFGLIRALVAEAKGAELPAILIHVYGDFTFYSQDMLSVFYLLQGRKVRPVCASHRQINIVNSLVSAPEGSIGYCPFPVNTKTFFPDPRLRAGERRRLGWAEDDFVLLYTGRLSLQKNVTLAITQAFTHLKKHQGRKWKGRFRFALAGKYDDLGVPFFGNYPPDGDYYFRIQKAIGDIDPSLGCVTYLGDLDSRRLNRVLNAADSFISLSTHHDEDYGMSPAEALACGLPCLLSDWGGYSSFAAVNSPDSRRVWLAPTGIDRNGFFFPQAQLEEAFSGLFSVGQSSAELRSEAARRIRAVFALDAAAGMVAQEILAAGSSTANGVKPAFLELAKRSIERREGGAKRTYSSYIDPLYLEIYSGYMTR